MGRVDGRLSRDVLETSFFRVVAHVGMIDVADRTPGRSGHAGRAEGRSPGPGQRTFTM